MKKITLYLLFIFSLNACKETPKTPVAPPAPTVIAPNADSIAIANTKATAGTTTSSDELIQDLAAFYNGMLPCKDCDGIQTMLTLNADAKRTYTLEEEHKGKKNKTVETSGTWTVADGVVTLQSKNGTTKYQVTKDGLVSHNADGTLRDAKTAMKFLLKKVQGE